MASYWNFVKNFVLNNFSWGHLFRPLNSQIELTCHCNARCVFCSMWEKDFQRNLEPEMTTKQVKHVIDGLAELGVLEVSFTGGEPTLRKDLPELIDYAAKKGLLPGLATNGYYLYDMIKSGKLKNLKWPMISIDWPDAERHDEYRKIEVFNRAVKGIKAAVNAKMNVVVSMVVTKDNIQYMEKMCQLAKEWGAYVEMLPCEDIIREQEESHHIVQEIEAFIPDIKHWAQEIRRLRKKYNNLVTDEVSAKIIEAGGFGNQNLLHCVSASAYISISYNGEMVFPCKIHPILKVDVKNRSLKEVYYSAEARKIMKMKDKFPFCKGCRLGCALAISIPNKLSTLYEKYIKLLWKGQLKA
jgi:MoaA/NifB/PqqE/SkfB family radical SAM enzyme